VAIPKKPAPGKSGSNSLVAITSKIKALEKDSIASVIAIGGLLEEAAKLIPRGEYGAWLKANFGWSSKTAYRYRMVSNLAVVCQIDKKIDIEIDLNLSISALYLLADMPTVDARSIAVIQAAKVGRVTYSMAKQIIADTDKDEAEKAAAREQRIIDERAVRESAPASGVSEAHPVVKPAEPDQATLDPVKGVIAAKVEQRKAAAAAAKATAQVVDTRKPSAPKHDDLARMLRLLDIRMHDAGSDVEMAVAEVGTVPIREIIGRLKAAIDKHDATNALVAKADRAEAGRKTKLDKTTIQAMADAAEAKSKASPPAADEFPDIPPGLDRRSKPQRKSRSDGSRDCSRGALPAPGLIPTPATLDQPVRG
jgi:hypothetical protein